MILSENMYVGEKAAEKKKDIIRKIKKGKVQFGKYVLALPFNDSDVLDIYPSAILVQKHYMDSDLFVVGIADGKKEADELMQTMLMDCYKETGGFDLRYYFSVV